MSTLIQNGTVVTAESTFPADILVEGEKIKEVRPGIPVNSADRAIDAKGMLLAAEVYVRPRGAAAVRCAKLHHQNDKRCIFRCGYRNQPAQQPPVPAGAAPRLT